MEDETSGESPDGDEGLRRDLARGVASDKRFDVLLPPTIRAASRKFWTPLAVAARAANLFEAYGAQRVLDIGSGPGKFCLAAAAAAPRLAFAGIEQRAGLVDVARRAASRLGLSNVSFRVGEAITAWQGFDGFYFYNPFGENLFPRHDYLDENVELSEQRFVAEAFLVERALLAARLGVVVITYHGFGGRMPRCFELSITERAGTDVLRVWRKRSAGCATDGYWLEDRGGGVREASFFDFIRDRIGDE